MNARNELMEELLFLDKTGIKDRILFARLIYTTGYSSEDRKEFILEENYSDEDLAKFLKDIDFNYDNGFGGQELYGVILMENGWFERYEYDGSESWVYKIKPSVERVKKFNYD